GAFRISGGLPRRDSTAPIVVPGGNDGAASAAQPATSVAASATDARPYRGVITHLLGFVWGGSPRPSPDCPFRRHEQRVVLAAGRPHLPGGGVEMDVENAVGAPAGLVPVRPDLLVHPAEEHRLSGGTG